MENFYEVVIIGGGPAGLTAALYLGRAGVKTLVIEGGDGFGGQMTISPLLENVPGFYGPGADLTCDIMDQIGKYESLSFEYEEVRKVEHTAGWEHRFRTTLQTGDSFYSNYVIAATGARPINLDVPGEERDHVHYCATCDGAFYKGKSVAVVGGGNSAMQYALELAEYCRVVSICTNEPELHGEQNLIDKVKSKENIRVYPCFETIEITDEQIRAKGGYGLIVDGIFIAIGHKPKTNYYDNCAKERGFFLTDEYCAVNSQGFYAVGDCRKKPFNQVVIAMADGCIAALDIVRKLVN